MKQDFVELTEIAGDEVTVEQVERICQRYLWAGEYCRGKEVLEVACGTGQGAGYLAAIAKKYVAGDYSEAILSIARRHYGSRIEFLQFDAQQIPQPDQSMDVVVIFEATYYLPQLELFFLECRRILRPGGVLLIATANKDLFDFAPSAHSYRYLGVQELHAELSKLGFRIECFGGFPVEAVSSRQRLLRPVKMLASRLGLIPKSMKAKKLLKRLVFGGLVKMPPEIDVDTCSLPKPIRLNSASPDRQHKVIFCAAEILH